MMKPRDFADAQMIIDGIKTGNVGRRDLTALLIYVREHLPDDMILDLAHSVAHSDRDRGYAYSYIDAFASKCISTAENGGALKIEVIFPRDALASEFARDLMDIGFNVTQDNIRQNMGSIESCLTDILADTVILLRNQKVNSCRIEQGNVDGAPKLGFVIYPQNLDPGALNIPVGVGFGFPVFSD